MEPFWSQQNGPNLYFHYLAFAVKLLKCSLSSYLEPILEFFFLYDAIREIENRNDSLRTEHLITPVKSFANNCVLSIRNDVGR